MMLLGEQGGGGVGVGGFGQYSNLISSIAMSPL